MAELNEDLHAQVKAEIEGKEITAAHRSMLFQKYGLQEQQRLDDEFLNAMWKGHEAEWASMWRDADFVSPAPK